MLRITDYVMRAAPLAVFAALAAVITVNGLDILLIYARFIASFYVGLGILWLILGMVAFLLIGRRSWTLAKHMRAPAMLAFSRSEEHTSELQSLMRTSYAVFCLKKTNQVNKTQNTYARHK